MLSSLLRQSKFTGCLPQLQHYRPLIDPELWGAKSNPCYSSSSITSQLLLRPGSSNLDPTQSAASLTTVDQTPSSPDASISPPKVSRRRLNTPPLPAWTPTRDLVKRNFLPRRMGFLMQELNKERAQAVHTQRRYPDFQAGDVLELKLVVPENRRRVSTFRGLCMAKKNRGWQSAFTLRNVIANAGPVERTFPLYSPIIEDLKIVEHRKVRRAKLYYLRGVNPKEYRA